MYFYDNYLINTAKIKNKKKLTQFKNDMLFAQVFNRLLETAMNAIPSIKRIPEQISERLYKQSIIFYGCFVFFDEPSVGMLGLPGVPSGKGYNINGDPVSAFVYSKNGMINKEVEIIPPGGENKILTYGTGGMNYNISNNKGVIIWANRVRYPLLDIIVYFASAIADTLRTIDVGKTWLKQPFISVCEESLVPSVEQMFKNIKNNEENINVSTSILSIDKFNILPVDSSGTGIKTAMELVEWYEQMFRMWLGLKANTAVDKKGENLIQDEVHINDSYTDMMMSEMSDYLNEQLELVNTVFGTNMKAELNDEIMEGDGDNEIYREEEDV